MCDRYAEIDWHPIQEIFLLCTQRSCIPDQDEALTEKLKICKLFWMDFSTYSQYAFPPSVEQFKMVTSLTGIFYTADQLNAACKKSEESSGNDNPATQYIQ